MMALELEPNHVGAHEYLGELYLMKDNLEKASNMLVKIGNASRQRCARI